MVGRRAMLGEMAGLHTGGGEVEGEEVAEAEEQGAGVTTTTIHTTTAAAGVKETAVYHGATD